MLQTITPYSITDLQSTDLTSFNVEATQWSSSALVASGVITSTCDKPIVGGYNVASGTGGAYFFKTYTSLPSHNVAYINMIIYALDTWNLDGPDSFEIHIDTVAFTGWKVLGYGNPYTTDICGSLYADNPPIYIKMVVPHSSTSLTLKVSDTLDDDTKNESLGFREITITLDNVASSPSATICGIQAIAMTDSRACPCDGSQYMKPVGSGTCYACDSPCTTCSGSSTQCLSCPTDMVLDSTAHKCYQCLSSSDCKSALSSRCSSKVCGSCLSNDDCSHISGLPMCSSGVCTKCQSNTDCVDPTIPICELSLGLCRARIVVAKPDITCIQDTQSPEDFTLSIPDSFMISPRVLLAFNVSLKGIDSQSYTYTSNLIPSTTGSIKFKVKATIPPTNIILSFTFENRTQDDTFTYSFPTFKIPYSSDSTKAAAAALQSLATAAVTAVASASGPMIVAGGNPAVLWTLFNLFQAFYYLILINVDYPDNVKMLLEVFKIAKLDFIPNPVKWVIPNILDLSAPAPGKFDENGFDGLFIANSGNILLVWVVLGLLFGFSLVAAKYLRILPKLIMFVLIKLASWCRWSGAYQIVDASYVSLLIPAFLQMRGLTFTSPPLFLSSILGMIFTLLGAMFPVLVFLIIRRFKKLSDVARSRYLALVEGCRLISPVARYFNILNIIKRFITCLALVFFYEYPKSVLATLSATNIILTALVAKFRPYKGLSSNITGSISEIMLEDYTR